MTPPRTSEAGEVPLPIPVSPQRNGKTTQPRTPDPARPTTKAESAPSADTAPGIPRYTILKTNVATGGQPTLEGMQWLKERGFRTVLNLLPETAADPAEASMVRQLGLEYISLPIAAGTLDRDTLEQFYAIADDANNLPLFIHDSSGSCTGALWYLHLVLVDKRPEEAARRWAGRIGLKDSDTELWLVIQRLIAENK